MGRLGLEPWTDDLPPPDEFAWVYDLDGGNIEAGDRLKVRCSNGEYWRSEPEDEEVIGWTEGTEFLAGNISGSSSDGQLTLRDSQGRVLQYDGESETIKMRVGGPPAQIHFIDVQRTAAHQPVYLQIVNNPELFITGGRGVCIHTLSPIAAYTAPDVRVVVLLDFNGGVLRNGDYLAITCKGPTELVFYAPNAEHEIQGVKAEVVQPSSIWRLLMSGDRVGFVQDDH